MGYDETVSEESFNKIECYVMLCMLCYVCYVMYVMLCMLCYECYVQSMGS